MLENSEYCSDVEKKEILQYAITWMHLKDVVVSETSWTQKDKPCLISLMCGILKSQTGGSREQTVVVRPRGRGKGEMRC